MKNVPMHIGLAVIYLWLGNGPDKPLWREMILQPGMPTIQALPGFHG